MTLRLAEFICTIAHVLEALSWVAMILCAPFLLIKLAEMTVKDLGDRLYNRETRNASVGAYPWRYGK